MISVLTHAKSPVAHIEWEIVTPAIAPDVI